MTGATTWRLPALPRAPQAGMPVSPAKAPRPDLAWSAQPLAARQYVAVIIAIGSAALIASVPTTYPRPFLFVALLVVACLTSVWKVNLPIPLISGSTLSVSYAADLAALLLLGRQQAVLIALAGVWMQCTFKVKHTYPWYRTVFSTAAEAVTMIATGAAYAWLGGPTGTFDLTTLAKPIVGAIATYFVFNTGLVATAVALSTRRSPLQVWRNDFLWSGVSFVVAGSTGAAAAVAIARGGVWESILLLAPVYLTYRTYRTFVGRLEDQRRHEQELSVEKDRLASALRRLTRLEDARQLLLRNEQAARASAEQANHLKDQFLAVVSHELRTPLNAVLGWSDMLRRGTVDPRRHDRAVQAIYEGALRQTQLIDDLLDVTRIVAGKLRLDRSAVDVEDIVSAAVEMVQPAAVAKHIELTVSIDPSLDVFLGDRARLQQIITNLLTNGVKFTPEGGMVGVAARRAGADLELIVADTGQGIATDLLPALFEPFRQGDGSSTRRSGGLGLGLSIVKHLVEAHGGTVRAESGGEGRGSTFTVRLPILPLAMDQAAAAHAGTEASPVSDLPLRDICVLVADDDTSGREMIAANLEGRGARVRSAASAAEAFELLQQERVDVLVSDIAMPGEDGYQLLRRVRGFGGGTSGVPAIALTAFTRKEDRERALEAGFQVHLGKPVRLDALVEAVERLAHHATRAAP